MERTVEKDEEYFINAYKDVFNFTKLMPEFAAKLESDILDDATYNEFSIERKNQMRTLSTYRSYYGGDTQKTVEVHANLLDQRLGRLCS